MIQPRVFETQAKRVLNLYDLYVQLERKQLLGQLEDIAPEIINLLKLLYPSTSFFSQMPPTTDQVVDILRKENYLAGAKISLSDEQIIEVIRSLIEIPQPVRYLCALPLREICLTLEEVMLTSDHFGPSQYIVLRRLTGFTLNDEYSYLRGGSITKKRELIIADNQAIATAQGAKEIATFLGVTRQRVWDIKDKALRILRRELYHCRFYQKRRDRYNFIFDRQDDLLAEVPDISFEDFLKALDKRDHGSFNAIQALNQKLDNRYRTLADFLKDYPEPDQLLAIPKIGKTKRNHVAEIIRSYGILYENKE